MYIYIYITCEITYLSEVFNLVSMFNNEWSTS